MMYGMHQKEVSIYRPYNGTGIPCHFRSVPFQVNFRAVAVLVCFQTIPVLSQGQPSVLVNGPDGKIKRTWSLIAQEFSVF